MTEPIGPPNNPSENFQQFFNAWLDRQQNLLQQLLAANEPENKEKTELQENLIVRVLSHYKHYYEVKASAAKENVFLFFSPPWLTGFERSLLWLGDFKPSIIFRLINVSVSDLTEAQSHGLQQVKVETKKEEKELGDAMAKIQESIASASMLNRLRQWGRLVDGEWSEMEEKIEELKSVMAGIMESADTLRGVTVEKVVDILNPNQTVKLLTAAAQYQLWIRRMGLSGHHNQVL